MTYIEFFDRVASENVSACLMCMPDRVIYIGDNGKLMKKHIENYSEVFARRGRNIEFVYKTISRSNLENAVSLLEEIVCAYDDCIFDLTGGEEILMLALGIVYARHPEKSIQLQKLNLRNNAIYDCDKDGVLAQGKAPELSVEDNIRIYGGAVSYGDITEEKTYLWDLNPEFLQDAELIWTVCKGNVRYWNTAIAVLEAAKIVGQASEDGLRIVAQKAAVEMYLARHNGKYVISKGIMRYLEKNGLLTFFEETQETITVCFKNLQVKKCLTKAGMALELKVYLTAKGLRDDDGNPVYNDALNGVLIDWDGELHDEEDAEEFDTVNEIDVMLMHNVIPVFVSCKNGVVNVGELYKLSTVAHRFGGTYAKPILVTTALSKTKQQDLYIRQRAEDMGIYILDDICELTDAEFERKLKTLWQRG